MTNEHQGVNLSQGFPDFDGPMLAKNGAIDAINAGHNQYAPMSGVPVLRHAIARWGSRITKIDPDRHRDHGDERVHQPR